MFKNRQTILYIYGLFIAILLSYPSLLDAQTEGISIHADFASIVIPSGLDNNFIHPGNFLYGIQFNFPTNADFELSAGLDFFYNEATGLINNEAKQVEVFIPSIFGGFILNFDNWGIFGKVGYSPAGSVNQLGKNGWVSKLPGFDMFPVQMGIKFNILKDLDITASGSYYIGNSVKIDDRVITFTTINIGLSYNLFSFKTETQDPNKSSSNYREMYNKLLTENEKLEKQNMHLIKQEDEITERLKRSKTGMAVKVDSALSSLQVRTISVDSINSVYKLHIGEELSIKDFVDKNGVSEDGKLILGEYNTIASSFKGFPSGIWFICIVPDTDAFSADKVEFQRIEFKNNSGIQKVLIIYIDVSKTETNNSIKLEIK